MGMNAGFLGSEKLMDAAGRPSFVVGEVVWGGFQMLLNKSTSTELFILLIHNYASETLLKFDRASCSTLCFESWQMTVEEKCCFFETSRKRRLYSAVVLRTLHIYSSYLKFSDRLDSRATILNLIC